MAMKKRYPHKERILLVNITRLGDMLQATPTIAGLKMENPNCHISVLVEKQFEDVCHSLPYIDEVLSLDLGMTVRSLAREQEGIVDAFEYLTDFVDKLRAKKFDYCLNMSSSAYTALLLKILNVGRYGGWTSDEEGYRVIESDWAKLFASSVYHQNRQYNSLNLVDVFRCSADVEKHPSRLLIDVSEESSAFARDLLAGAGFTNKGALIAVQAGASQGKRQWNPRNFIRMLNILVKENDARVVLVGTKKELSIIDPIKQGCASDNVFVAAGKTNIPQLAALLKECDLLITGDTGPMHMSVAVGTPVVSMFLASAFGFETGPYSEGNIVLQPVIGCGPCNPNKSCNGLECHDCLDPELIAYLALRRVKEDFSEVPDSIANPSKVIVYRSYFDQFGYCDLKPLNSTRFDIVKKYRDAYRKVWLEDLGGFNVSELAAPSTNSLQVRYNIEGLEQVIRLAQAGQAGIAELIALVKDPVSIPSALGEVNQRIVEIDREIEQTGFHYAHLGPVTRMFVFSKENMTGTDPIDLASQMRSIYEDLIRRCLLLERYFI